MLGKRLLQSLPKILTLTHNPKTQNKQLKTAHARSIDRGKKLCTRDNDIRADELVLVSETVVEVEEELET